MNKKILSITGIFLLASITLTGCGTESEPAPTPAPDVKKNVKPLEKQTPEEKAFLNNAYVLYSQTESNSKKWDKVTAGEALTWGNKVCADITAGKKLEDITVNADEYKTQLALSAQERLCP